MLAAQISLSESASLRIVLDEAGRLEVTEYAGGRPRVEVHRVPAPSLSRVRAEVRNVQAGRFGGTLGYGEASALLTVGQRSAVVRYTAGRDPLDTSSWKTPRAARLLVLLADLVRAARGGTLGSFEDGLPDAISEVGLALRFRTQGTGAARALVAAYHDGRVERWDTSDGLHGWTGSRLDSRFVGEALVATAYAAATALDRALTKSAALRGGPYTDVGSDPTESLSLEIFRGKDVTHHAFAWGRASRNDSSVSPVPPDVPLSLFDAVIHALAPLDGYGVQPDRPQIERPVAPTPKAPSTPPTRTPLRVEDLLDRLLRAPPKRLSELEAIVGPLRAFESEEDGWGHLLRPTDAAALPSPLTHLAIGYALDLQNERPYGPSDGRSMRDPAIVSFEVGFQRSVLRRLRGMSRVHDALRRTHRVLRGEPFVDEKRRGERFKNFAWYEGTESLAWFSSLPDWAIETSREDPRHAWLTQLGAHLAGGCSHDALVAFSESAPAGVRVVGSMQRDDLQLSLDPPMDALALAQAFRIAEPRAHAGDVHASLFTLVVARGARHLPAPVGPWAVDITLRGRPNPEEPTVVSASLGPVYDLRRIQRMLAVHVTLCPDRWAGR